MTEPMPLTIRDTKTTPRERQWAYPGINGSFVTSNSYMVLRLEITQHYTTNGQPVPSDEEITKYLCDNLTIPCFEGTTPYVNQFTNPPSFLTRGLPSPDWGSLNFLKLMAKDGDKGLGDIIARIIGPVGGDAFKRWYKRLFGRDCGCSERQEDFNLTYPL